MGSVDRHTKRQPKWVEQIFDALKEYRLLEFVVGGAAAGATGAVIAGMANIFSDLGDLLGFLGAFVGAIATVGGAIYFERRRRLEERSEATNEILRCACNTLFFYEQAEKLQNGAVDVEPAKLVSNAKYLLAALDRLLNRTILTDGAIITGVAAMQLLQAIVDEDTERRKPAKPNVTKVDYVGAAAAAKAKMMDRAKRVASYARRKRWPKSHDRFAQVAEFGLQSEHSDEARAS